MDKDFFIERVWMPKEPDKVKVTKKGMRPSFYFSFRYGSIFLKCITVWMNKEGFFLFGSPGAYTYAGRVVYPIQMAKALKYEVMAQVAEKNPLGLSPIQFLSMAKTVIRGEAKAEDILKRKSVAF